MHFKSFLFYFCCVCRWWCLWWYSVDVVVVCFPFLVRSCGCHC